MIKKLFCKIKWHSWPVGFDVISKNQVNTHAKCKWCGYKGMVDSTGALF